MSAAFESRLPATTRVLVRYHLWCGATFVTPWLTVNGDLCSKLHVIAISCARSIFLCRTLSGPLRLVVVVVVVVGASIVAMRVA